jgi:hypothetical protein
VPPGNRSRNRRTLRFALAGFGGERLAAESARSGMAVEDVVRVAVQHYVSELASFRMARRFPAAMRIRRPASRSLEIASGAEPGAWRALAREAKRQGVSTEQLLEHAALCYLADLDSGRGGLAPAPAPRSLR